MYEYQYFDGCDYTTIHIIETNLDENIITLLFFCAHCAALHFKRAGTYFAQEIGSTSISRRSSPRLSAPIRMRTAKTIFPSFNSVRQQEDSSAAFTICIPLPPDIANGTIIFPSVPQSSRNVFTTVGATPHQIGKPTKNVPYSSALKCPLTAGRIVLSFISTLLRFAGFRQSRSSAV